MRLNQKLGLWLARVSLLLTKNLSIILHQVYPSCSAQYHTKNSPASTSPSQSDSHHYTHRTARRKRAVIGGLTPHRIIFIMDDLSFQR